MKKKGPLNIGTPIFNGPFLNQTYNPLLPHTTNDKENVKITIKDAQPRLTISIRISPFYFKFYTQISYLIISLTITKFQDHFRQMINKMYIFNKNIVMIEKSLL